MKPSSDASKTPPKAISVPDPNDSNTTGSIVFLLSLSVVGAVWLWAWLVVPLSGWTKTLGWVEVPCIIRWVSLEAPAETESGSSSEQGVSLGYSYSFEGTPHTGTRYGVLEPTRRNTSELKRIAKSYPAGAATVCFVNSEDSTEAILVRELPAEILWSLIPIGILSFVAISSFRLYRRCTSSDPIRPAVPPDKPPAVEQVEPTILAPRASNAIQQTRPAADDSRDRILHNSARVTPVSQMLVWLVGTSFFAGFPASFGGVGVWLGWMFGAIGLSGMVYWGLACLNPGIKVTLSHQTLVPGRPTMLKWVIPKAKPDLLNRLTMTLTATEYEEPVGDSDGRVSVMTVVELLDARGMDLRSGEVEIRLPSSSMHSFEGSREHIYWTLAVRGYIAFWPDMNREFRVAVRPRKYRWGEEPLVKILPLPKPPTARLEILSTRRNFRPGELIDTDVGWNLERSPEYLELRVVWNNRYSREVNVVDAYRLTSPKPRETRRVSLTLPSEPYSFVGRYIQIEWAFELIAFPSCESIREVIAIGPGARRVAADMIRQYWADVRNGTA